jgi:hypothetical protein
MGASLILDPEKMTDDNLFYRNYLFKKAGTKSPNGEFLVEGERYNLGIPFL